MSTCCITVAAESGAAAKASGERLAAVGVRYQAAKQQPEEQQPLLMGGATACWWSAPA